MGSATERRTNSGLLHAHNKIWMMFCHGATRGESGRQDNPPDDADYLNRQGAVM